MFAELMVCEGRNDGECGGKVWTTPHPQWIYSKVELSHPPLGWSL